MSGGTFGSTVLEALFPGRCLLCGTWLLGSGSAAAPVCTECLGSLATLQGERCEKCGTPLVSEQVICTRCRVAEFAFDTHRSLFAYAGPVRELIARLKFEHRSRLAGFFAGLLAERILCALPGIPVVPVPGRSSGDAVELIARQLRARHGIPVLRLLRRSGGRPQKTLDLGERRENLRGKIRLVPAPVPEHVILMDDIFTTGATADACAGVLRAGGCSKVSALTIAMEE